MICDNDWHVPNHESQLAGSLLSANEVNIRGSGGQSLPTGAILPLFLAEICRVEGITAFESARRYVPDPHGGEDSPFAAKSGTQNAWRALWTPWPFIMLNHRKHQLVRRDNMKPLYFSMLGYLYQVISVLLVL